MVEDEALGAGERARRLRNWLDSWLEYTNPLPSPMIWRKWAGIACIAAALERKVWTKTAIGILYPNLYIILVGPPGGGKTILTNTVWEMLKELTDGTDAGFHLAASSLTSASIIDDLRDAKRTIMRPGSVVSFNSLAVVSNELSVFLPEYENAFMAKLTDIYDGHSYSERRRTDKLNFEIPAPQLNLLAATTPSYMNTMLPAGAWDQGFLARTLLVFSGEAVRRSIWVAQDLKEDLHKNLRHDLLQIFSTYGKITWSAEAAAAISNWYDAGSPPVPEHPKLQHYNSRRTTQLLKLCMIAAVAAGRLEVYLEDFHRAVDWLLELEAYLPDIFKAMVTGGDSEAMKECWHFVGQEYAKNDYPVPEAKIIAFLAEKVPAHSIQRVVEVMVQMRILREEDTDRAGNWYSPAPRKPGT